MATSRRASLVIQGRVAYAPDKLYDTMGYKPFVGGAVLEPGKSEP